MFAVERQKKIIESLKNDGSVLVSKLSLELGVTEETVRRDLEKLEKQEALVRTHGGAIPVDESNHEMSLEKRKHLNANAKERLAKEAVKHILPGDTVFLDASTTTFYMARELKNLKDITIVTNSIRVISELAGHTNLKVIGVGGLVSNNQSFVGTLANNYINENCYANKVFFSSRGVTVKGDILDSNEQEWAVKQSMINNSDKRFYLCDKSKIGRIGFAKLAEFSDIDYFISEKGLSEEIYNLLEETEVKVITV
jgi:DeoR/GlpR family transcriptional regulator of sugar metabolism